MNIFGKRLCFSNILLCPSNVLKRLGIAARGVRCPMRDKFLRLCDCCLGLSVRPEAQILGGFRSH